MAGAARPVLRLFGRPSSSNTQKVLWLLRELNAPFELTLASARLGAGSQLLCEAAGTKPFGVVGTPEYAKLNPTRGIPTLVDGDVAIWESHSILRYLASKYGAALHLDDEAGMARCSPWMDWALWVGFHNCNHHWVDQLARTKPESRDVSVIERAYEGYVQKFDLAEKRLAETGAFLAGDRFTIADVPLGVELTRWGMGLERWAAESAEGRLRAVSSVPAFPHLAQFFRRLQQRPAFVEGCLALECEHYGLPPPPGVGGAALDLKCAGMSH